ncbi:MAG TPA: cytochrome bd-I oxidase subunit CydX [Cycloclasticus sp.]|jgi:cyd operon protein YbgT|nr:cytochrome bd-I oxidase subunit CydX [Cycloclasticus sp.]
MWYFAWILGVLLACSFGIINAMWLEYNDTLDKEETSSSEDDRRISDRRRNPR